jgi:putative tricarboxylic transport membrane protein
MARADLITSIALMALGTATAIESWRMPRYTDVQSDIWSAPGIVPGLLGVALVFMASILGMRALAARGEPSDEASFESGAFFRIGTTVALCVLYAGVLVNRIPFWLATFVFVFVFIAVFELIEAEARRRWMRHVAIAMMIAAVTSGTVSYIFANIFFVRLP